MQNGNLCMKIEDIVSVSEAEDPNRRGGPIGGWNYRVKEYMWERGASVVEVLEQAKRKYLDRERGRLFCCGCSHGGCSRRE